MYYPRIGLIYYPNQIPKLEKQEKQPYTKEHLLNLQYGWGTKQIQDNRKDFYTTWVTILAWEYHFSPKYYTGAGFDMYYDESLVSKAEVKYGDKEALYSSGFFGTFGWQLGQFSIYAQAGTYLYNRYRRPIVYNRLGIKLFPFKWTYIHVSMKSHGTQADNLEVGLGISPRLFKN